MLTSQLVCGGSLRIGGFVLLTYLKAFRVKSSLLVMLIFFVVASIWMTPVVIGESTPEAKSKNVLVIHTYHQGQSLTDSYDEAISEAFFSRSTYALSYIFSEHLESERIVNEDDFF